MKKQLIYLLIVLTACAPQQSSETESMKESNALISESSPYLLQHAYNPVKWQAWHEEAFEQAKREDKLVLVSIGYSSCHWCHVMEHETFEDQEAANLMNENFVNIKVDREEHPDVDHYYMTAVQLMTGSGGWPLNVIALPDGRPVWGGTYFPKAQWMSALTQIADLYVTEPQKIIEYADRLEKGMVQSEQIVEAENPSGLTQTDKEEALITWMSSFDTDKGGYKRAPKFPLPNNWLYLLNEGIRSNNESLLKQVELTLDEMSNGGIYDQVGGGFARYSTDADWKAPHFEKMLYDNAQLLELYARGYQHFKKDRYKFVIDQTIDWLNREMKAETGLYYSALDADSEGEEGKFYVWTKEELQSVLKDDFDDFEKVYPLNGKSKWEGNYILLRQESEDEIRKGLGLNQDEFEARLAAWHAILLEERAQRERPGLDSKCLSVWNAQLLSAFTAVYKAMPTEEHLSLAAELFKSIKAELQKGGKLYHQKTNAELKREALADDLAFVAKSALDWFEISANMEAYSWCRKLMNQLDEQFFSEETGYHSYRPQNDESWLITHFERRDNVIPATNGVIAHILFVLSRLEHLPEYELKVNAMLVGLQEEMKKYPEGYSNWWELQALTQRFKEVVIIGEAASEIYRESLEWSNNEAFVIASRSELNLELFKNRMVEGDTYIYVCENKACKLPVKTWREAQKLLN